MNVQKFFLSATLSLFSLFAIAPQPCAAMQAASGESAAHIDVIIWDLFRVLFWVDKAQAELEVQPSTPSSPKFSAERTMRGSKWYDMDLGRLTKEHVAREAADKGDDYGAVLRYIENIGTWVKPIQAGMELFTRLRNFGYAMLLLSNISTYCLAGINNPGYFPRVNGASTFRSPDVFAEVNRMRPHGFELPEGYSCSMGLGKPDVLCYKYFLVLNCPEVPDAPKVVCKAMQSDLLRSLREQFELEDAFQHEPTKSPAREEAFKKRMTALEEACTRLRRALTEHIEAVKARCPELVTFMQRCAFVDDSPRNLDGAEKAGIYPISCQCHAVAYLTMVKKGIIEPDAEYEELLNATPASTGDLAHFGGWSLEALHDYARIDRDLQAMHPENFC